MPTTTHKIVKNVLVAVHTAEMPSDAEWQAFFEFVDRHHPIHGMLVFSEGGAPDAKQRDYAERFWRTHVPTPAIAVLTPSWFTKATASALGWLLGDRIKVFAAEDLGGACAYLRLSADQRSALEAALRDMKKELGMIR